MSLMRPPTDDGDHLPQQSESPAVPPEADQPIRQDRRIPNPGNAATFFAFALAAVVAAELILAAMGRSPSIGPDGGFLIPYPKSQLVSQGAAYLATLATSWFFFPVLWHRSFAIGIRWNFQAARPQLGRLLGAGMLLGIMAAAVNALVAQPKDIPIDKLFATQSDAWLTTVFGILIAPLCEEIAFRGFLLPAFAIAYDWIALPRTDAARTHWRSTSTLSPGSYIFAAILSSVFFAMLHAQQVAHIWVALATIFSVSLVLTFVRVKTQSVACSAIVHSAYNSFVFLTVLIATGGYRHLDRMTR